jgi:hypothetical protein
MEQQLVQFFSNPLVIVPFVFWNAFWKGMGFWKSANNKHISWFVIFLFVNLFGIIEILYIFKLNKYDLGSKDLLGEINKIFKKKA